MLNTSKLYKILEVYTLDHVMVVSGKINHEIVGVQADDPQRQPVRGPFFPQKLRCLTKTLQLISCSHLAKCLEQIDVTLSLKKYKSI